MEQEKLIKLRNLLDGELFTESHYKAMYATDASVYRKLPLAVSYPKNNADVQRLIQFVNKEKSSLIPRTAGTSLAGQCVGDGIVMDMSKYMNRIISFDLESKQVTVQPGVIRDELNKYLKPHGLFFGPNTSTSNRCMIGGMIGNNSSGTTSIQYGVTREKIVQLKTILSDGSEVIFDRKNKSNFNQSQQSNSLESLLYQQIELLLSSKEVQNEIIENFPKPEIHRRNTGYAIDELIKSSVFNPAIEKEFSFCDLLSGSEGTLAISTEITLQLDRLPPSQAVMIAAHYPSIEACMLDVTNVMQHNLFTCEMMDKVILDCTKNNKLQSQNRFFIQEDPKAILMLELRSENETSLDKKTDLLIEDLKKSGHSYAFPILKDEEINQAMELRKAGLGLLGNIIGDKKAVACIEDTAVVLDDLAPFISEFTEIMNSKDQDAVYYAHAGAGEIHLRPILDLKKKVDLKLFREITTEVALLTKKYGGSFSGEHGDGIVRAEFLPLMIGEKNYELCRAIKHLFDPNNIFNPGKIVAPFPMDESIRYETDRQEPEIKTLMNFDDSQGYLRAIEKCNGSGDCRKGVSAGGTMCPSYRATKDEKDVTRGRANVLREFLTNPNSVNHFDSPEIKEVLDLCISCKACASECPSNVDIAVLKSEFTYQYNQIHKPKRRDRIIAKNDELNKKRAIIYRTSNFFSSNQLSASLIKTITGIAAKRDLPKVGKSSFKKLLANQIRLDNPIKSIVLFVDEFSNYQDQSIAFDTYKLLIQLNYQVILIDHLSSGRTYISKGYLKEAKGLAERNVAIFDAIVSKETPLVGIEPSAILSFRDEYIRLVDHQDKARKIAKHTFLIEEFIANEIELGNITSKQFTSDLADIKIHTHCHQKALSNQKVTFDILNLPINYKPRIIASGCCGMAGSFGYEKEHYELSIQIGEQSLFPAIRKSSLESIIVANGTSCRHQIKDGTDRNSFHPVEVLLKALK